MATNPATTQQISAHPGKNSVTDPTNRDKMQADVDRKLRFYGVIEAFRQGRMPNNRQIDETLAYVNQHSPIDTSKLSPAGNKLISDTRDIIETARLIVQEKNEDELFQNFIYHTNGTDINRAKVDKDEVTPVSKDEAKRDGDQAVQHLRTLLSLIFTNSEARKLLSDSSIIGRDLFARGAIKVAEKSRPTEDERRQVDDAAPSNAFTAPDGSTRGPNDPVPPASVGPATVDPRTGQTTVETRDGTMTGNQVLSRAQNTVDQAKTEANAHANDVQRQVDSVDDPEAKKEVAKSGFMDKMRGMKDRVPQEHKDRAADQYQRSKDFLRDEFPQERREQFIYRLKKVIVECQKHQDYQEAITWFINSFERYFEHGRNVANTGANAGGNLANDPALNRATVELRTLLERFANGRSLDGIINAAQRLSDDAQTDQGLKQWFHEFDLYVKKTLLEPGYVLSPQCNNEANRLVDQGQQYFDGKYKAHMDNLLNETQTWFVAFGEDPLNKRFGEDWARLTKDLLFDEEGSLQFKPQLWSDIRRVILPTLVEQVGYVPIPRIEYTDNQLDLVIENLTLQGRNLFPNIVEVDARNHVVISPYSAIPDQHNHSLTLTFAQIQADMRDVAFYFNKKSGIPKFRDSGLADVLLGGEGLTVTVGIQSAGKDRSSVFHVKDVNVKLDTLKFSVRDSKHDLLYKTLKPLATGLVKKQIAKAIQDSIRTGLEYVDGQLVQVRDRMAEASASDTQTRTQVLKDMFERRQDQAKTAANQAAAKRDSQFKIVAKRDSVIVDAGYEKGWINRQAELQEKTTQSEGWKSAAFDIVGPAAQPGATGGPINPVTTAGK